MTLLPTKKFWDPIKIRDRTSCRQAVAACRGEHWKENSVYRSCGLLHLPSKMKRLFLIIRKLLRRPVEKRLGTSGADAVKAHRFFSSVDWRMVEEKRYPPPHIPSFSNKSDATDVSQFDPRFTSRTPRESEVRGTGCMHDFAEFDWQL